MQNTHEVSTTMVPDIKLELADDRGENELDKDSVKH